MNGSTNLSSLILLVVFATLSNVNATIWIHDVSQTQILGPEMFFSKCGLLLYPMSLQAVPTVYQLSAEDIVVHLIDVEVHASTFRCALDE